ncbi:hypothetical protein [Rhodococcus tibetensis]|uniref:Uncharacterized protein n=1 Tax=Rhodococcus tibetensis TaxID=2965064 RepID=A0ABT1QK53_9NOCA|nr:hypothetical protein [Rhodococcus sp. FXJ9.536]MCQ4122649.1 hypothetical protein [Rhodococcus sp. FXJ9.536]
MHTTPAEPATEAGPPTLISPVTPIASRRLRTDTVSWGPMHGAPTRARKRLLPIPPGEPEKPLVLHDSWAIVVAAALVAAAVLASVVWISAHIEVDPVLHMAALFVHLASLVLGFGGVLIADYLVLVWISGRSTLAEAIRGAERLHLPIWAGLAGLVASGAFLEPNLTSVLTRTKLGLVLVLTINGLQALILSRHIAHSNTAHLPPRLTVWGVATATISQVCWWGAVWIGFWNAEH